MYNDYKGVPRIKCVVFYLKFKTPDKVLDVLIYKSSFMQHVALKGHSWT